MEGVDNNDKVPDDKIDGKGSESVKMLKIRADLEEYFEVISHQDKTLRCKLAGRDSCKIDGVKVSLKFSPHRGWYNIERHVRRAHKVGKLASSKSPELRIKGRKKTEKSKSAQCTGSISSSGSTEKKWRNLFSKEKYCLVCCNVCPVAEHESTDEEYHYQLRRLFPGCEGSTRLSQQLFFIFFLRNIAELPGEKCEEFLKKCRGQRMPETWFSLCLTCRDVILQAAAINDQLIRLRKKLRDLRELIKSKLKESVGDGDNSAAYWSTIEQEIRNYIFNKEAFPIGPLDCENQNGSQEDDYIVLDTSSFEEEWTAADIKVETNDVVESVPSIQSDKCTRRGRKPRKNYTEMEYVEDEGDQINMHESTVKDSVSHDPVIKVEQEAHNDGNDDSDIDMEKSMANILDEDDDFEVPQSELSGMESDDSDFSPKKPSKAKQATSSSRVKIRTESALHQETSAKSNTDVPSPNDLSDINSTGGQAVVEKRADSHLCPFCPSVYRSNRSLQEHLEAHEISKTQDNKHDCKQCGYPCHTEKARKLHVNVKHGSEGGLPCTLCDHVSKSQKQYSKHLREHKEEAERERVEGKYFCKFCDRLFITFDILSKHKRTLHYKEIGVVPYRCEYCALILSTKRLLRDHVQQTHKKQSRYFCELCGKGMLYMSKLRRHMNGHLKEKSFVCEICGADFNYNETLKQHMKKEHPDALETTEKVDPSAQTNFVKNNKYPCKHCGTEFASSTLLCRHIKSHTELYANKCDLCGKGYATPQSLRRHKEINHTKNEVACTFCGKIFPHREYIRNHYRFCRHHPEKKQPNSLTGEPLQNPYTDAQAQISEEASDILETAIASSFMGRIQESSLASDSTGTTSTHRQLGDQNTRKVQTVPLLLGPITSSAEYNAVNQAHSIHQVITHSWTGSTDSGQ